MRRYFGPTTAVARRLNLYFPRKGSLFAADRNLMSRPEYFLIETYGYSKSNIVDISIAYKGLCVWNRYIAPNTLAFRQV